LSNVSSITGNLAGGGDLTLEITSTLASIRQAGDDFAEASRAVTELGKNTDLQIQKLAADTSLMMSDLQQTIARVDTLIETTNGTVGKTNEAIDPAVLAMEEFQLASQDLRMLIRRLDSVAREIEENPQAFIAGNPKPYEGGR